MAFSSSDIDRLTGAAVRGSQHEKIGSIGQVYVDQSGAPNWATVKTGLFGTSESFIPLDHASFDGDAVYARDGRSDSIHAWVAMR